MISAHFLRDNLSYDEALGQFRWKVAGPKRRVGMLAGTVNGRGYVQIGLSGKVYLAHRLAWLYVHGEWPSDQIDHKDGDTQNNRLANLRQCTGAENAQNRSKHRNNTSGSTGVYQDSSGAFCARIRSGRSLVHLGTFPSADAAASAYRAAKANMHEFAPIPRET